jgi:hypothetical protein
MELYDINQLVKNDGSGDFYDLFEIFFRIDELTNFRLYTVQRGEEMRMDLVCQSIYDNTQYVDFLCNLNKISNPLNIKFGDTMLYVDREFIERFRVKPKTQTEQQVIAKSNRGTLQDKSRQDYIENNFSLPPNVLERPSEQVLIKGSVIKLGMDYSK